MALCEYTSTLLAFKHTLSGVYIFFPWVWVVRANARWSLLEVDVDSDGLYVVERVLLVEG